MTEESIISAESSASQTSNQGDVAPAQPREGSASPMESRRTSLPGNLIRGAMIGTVETVPGVSGGTVALVVGIYRHLIDSASHVVSAGRALISGPDRRASSMQHLRLVEWKVIIPVMIGMIVAVFTIAGPMSDAVEAYPELTRAAFFGMVLASIFVPLQMAWFDRSGPLKASHVLAGIAAAGLTFWLVSLPPTAVEPTWYVILPAAAIAVSALLLPGLSGSFLLLTFGLYEPTLRAAADRDLAYLGIFALGLALGVISIVKGLKWLLDHRHRITMVVLAGVMLGALRTLWPWQDEGRGMLAPGDDLGQVLLLGAAGFAVVLVLVLVDYRLAQRQVR
ncbi:DUF368 domain-containing protein [Nesterenkonia sp. YGD6]|uniref:DUF368 domain-containing protein n=1 Tax=Nesterenkonia sp. YGD6 TaxID=2901231 RepID=UPI001F4CF3F8|nr:DUF368 domain-containing protein [Nesterenkonia sp. YGD6]MCH8562687.1 DUF368 domain-containing protein [Nesterenkonia sp. YGD6]